MAKIGIGIQLVILIRFPAEVFRRRYLQGSNLSLAAVEPFIRGELITAVCAALAVAVYFWNKHQGTIWTAAMKVIVLLAYKALFM
ncbi:MAG TPA: hypothetical protein VFP59_10055 [Candidatus Angelobacter sp.]|nr:hypothetical protein [Candidatus Angelobacter sp.]